MKGVAMRMQQAAVVIGHVELDSLSLGSCLRTLYVGKFQVGIGFSNLSPICALAPESPQYWIDCHSEYVPEKKRISNIITVPYNICAKLFQTSKTRREKVFLQVKVRMILLIFLLVNVQVGGIHHLHPYFQVRPQKCHV
jgi:hypothetical protein